MEILKQISNLKRRLLISRQAILLLSACLLPAKGQSNKSADMSSDQFTRPEDPFQHIKQIFCKIPSYNMGIFFFTCL
jgi:outer membrane biogenesis lipoprotein LolB